MPPFAVSCKTNNFALSDGENISRTTIRRCVSPVLKSHRVIFYRHLYGSTLSAANTNNNMNKL